ncbi:DUF3667 domain-containing protein [Nonlabens sp.]|uniref:DUF3667 domain-containing protein n=1 Tax=Nonlabens sp. TaxID=1888209 RepID=UPI003F69E676
MKPTVRSLAEFRGQQCLNCETPLDVADKYCHQCGQLNTTKKLALKDFFSEFFASIISYDSRVWRTITTLLIKPGQLTLEYCNGKRIQYANPFRFFLTVSIVFFLVLQIGLQLTETLDIEVTAQGSNAGLFNVSQDSTATATDREEIIKIMKHQQDSLSEDQNIFQKLAINKAIEAIEKDTLTIPEEKRHLTQEEIDASNFLTIYFNQVSVYANYQSDHPEFSIEEALTDLGHRIESKNIARYKKAQKLNSYEANPTELINLILPKIPLFLFFFAPALSLFFWLIYARGTWNYMEHMVFNFHLLTFIFLMFFLIVAEGSLTDTSYIALIFFTILGPLYLYKALRKFYQQNRFKTILKFLFINFVFLVLIMISSTLFLLGSIYISI